MSNAIETTIEPLILVLRGKRVILDADLARLYGATTARFNEQVRRNESRFPPDFMFRLTSEEKDKVIAKCDHLRRLKFSRWLPTAFTEHGAIMAANVLNSERAIEVSVLVVRAFVRMRDLMALSRELSSELTEIKRRLADHDTSIESIVNALRQLMQPDLPPQQRIGFGVEGE